MLTPSSDTRERDAIIKALVKMLGGAVTIQPHDLDLLDRTNLSVSVNKDPEYLILKVEEV